MGLDKNNKALELGGLVAQVSLTHTVGMSSPASVSGLRRSLSLSLFLNVNLIREENDISLLFVFER